MESWTWILFNCSFYDESVVSTTSLRINFRENVIATFSNYDHKRKLHVIQKRQTIWSVSRTINDCEYSDVYQSATVLTSCSNLDSPKTDDQLMRSWSEAILTESKVSELCGCLTYIFPRVGLRKENEIPLFRNWFPSVIWDMICIRKFSISCHSECEII